MAPKMVFSSYTFLILGLLCKAIIVASASTESSATLTKLPPASPTGNSSDPCNFTDRYSLIDRVDADWRGYNISLLVATCEGVCPLVYGSGNPDISGIGAMISYVIQTVVVLLFGPLFALLSIIYNFDLSAQLPEPRDRRSRLFGVAGELSRSFQTGNILTSLSVLIASIIRIQQLAPVAELSFIKLLALNQLTIAAATSSSYGVVFGTNSAQFVLLLLYAAASIVTFGVISSMNGYPSSKATLLDKITWYCVFDWDYPIPGLYIEDVDEKRDDTVLLSTLIGGYIVFLIITFLVFKYFEAWLQRIYAVCQDNFIALCKRFHVDPKRLLLGLCISIMTALWVTYSVGSLWQLQSQRQQLQLISGNAYQDSEWGLGQITAILLWWPIFHEIILGIFG